MAAMDYGVITLKNGELLGGYKANGMMAEFEFRDLIFYKTRALQDLGYYDLDLNTYTPRLSRIKSNCHGRDGLTHWVEYFYVMDSAMSFKTVTINHDGVDFHIKDLGHGQFYTNFRFDGDRYDILFGFDISFNSFWEKRTHKVVQKFLTKYSKGVTIKPYQRHLTNYKSKGRFEGEYVVTHLGEDEEYTYSRYKKLPSRGL